MGLLKLEDLNKTYALGKAKQSDPWEVCVFAGASFYSVDGLNRKLGSRDKHRTRHRFFREAVIHESAVPLKPNDRVVYEDEEGRQKNFYIVCSFSKSTEGKFTYVAAI